MNFQLIVCPACKNKISSAASACPHCGHPNISPIQQLARQSGAITEEPAKRKLNVSNGFCALLIQAFILLLLIGFGYCGITIGVIGATVAFLYSWIQSIISAAKHNEIGKIILLVLLPSIGIIVCAFLEPEP